MRNFWLVARREFVERGRTSGYLITTLFMMVLMLFSTLAPVLFDDNKKTAKPIAVAVLDGTGQLAAPLKQALDAINASGAKGVRKVDLQETHEDEAALLARARRGSVDALIIEGSLSSSVKARYLSSSPNLFSVSGAVMGPLTEIVRGVHLQQLNLDPTKAAQIIKPMETEEKQLAAGSGERDQGAFMISMVAAMGAVMLNYMVTLLNSQFVFQGVLEEKISRVMEVMASSVRPTEMMGGKLAGLGGLGLVQFGAFMGAWYAGNAWARTFSDMAPAGIPSQLLVLTLVYLVLGYLLNGSLMAAAASTLSRMEDAQTMQMPLTMLLVLPMLFLTPVLGNPNGTLALVLSFIPFFTPTIMLLRVALSDVPTWQILTSMGLMAVTTYVMVRGSARVYRAAMLSYGGRPSLKQLWGYLRIG